MLERMGASMGIDLPALLAQRRRGAGWLADETLHGMLVACCGQAGLPRAQAAASANAPAGLGCAARLNPLEHVYDLAASGRS
jgi:hypothetical protein